MGYIGAKSRNVSSCRARRSKKLSVVPAPTPEISRSQWTHAFTPQTMYLDKDGPITPVLHLNRVCNRVHLILGCIHDFMCVPSWLPSLTVVSRLTSLRCCAYTTAIRPEEVQKALVDPKSGRQFASVTHMQTAGHLVSIFFT